MASSSKQSLPSLPVDPCQDNIMPMKRVEKMLEKHSGDKLSVAYQQLSWEALQKNIRSSVNKVNVRNVAQVARELFAENLIRGRGPLTRIIMYGQTVSPGYSDVFASLVAVINSRIPAVGRLLVSRLIMAFRKGYKRRDKNLCLDSVKFIAHLVNQRVVTNTLALELLILLLDQPSDESVEIALSLLKECGAFLNQVTPRALIAIAIRLRALLSHDDLSTRMQYLTENMIALIFEKFRGFRILQSQLDLVEEDDQYTHPTSLGDPISQDTDLDLFRFDENFLGNEARYEKIKQQALADEEEVTKQQNSSSSSSEENGEESSRTAAGGKDVEEAVGNLLEIKMKRRQRFEFCKSIVEEKTSLCRYALLAERLCRRSDKFHKQFRKVFKAEYSSGCRQLDAPAVENVAKFFAKLLSTSAIRWSVLSHIELTQKATTVKQRNFVRTLFQELAALMSVERLERRLKDPKLKSSLTGIFPVDSLKNIQFVVNFFTEAGLDALTQDIDVALKNAEDTLSRIQQQVDDLASINSHAVGDESYSHSAALKNEEVTAKRNGRKRPIISSATEIRSGPVTRSAAGKLKEAISVDEDEARRWLNKLRPDKDGDERKKRKVTFNTRNRRRSPSSSSSSSSSSGSSRSSRISTSTDQAVVKRRTRWNSPSSESSSSTSTTSRDDSSRSGSSINSD